LAHSRDGPAVSLYPLFRLLSKSDYGVDLEGKLKVIIGCPNQCLHNPITFERET